MSDETPVSLLSMPLQRETDVVLARQRSRQITSLLGFDHQDQVRIATAVSEIARNALQYASGGHAEYVFHIDDRPQRLEIRISDSGSGIAQLDRILDGRYQSSSGMGLGITGARRLMDDFGVQSSESGTTVSLSKLLPSARAALDRNVFRDLAAHLSEAQPEGALEEIRRQNQELLQALEEIRTRQTDLSHLNQELEETNRGVLALYAELDDKAASLRRADEIKSRFLSHMSHEFRTPLNSILALSRLVLEETDGALTSEQKKQMGYIRSAAQELFEMVNDLLDLAKVEAGRVDVHTSEVNVAEVFGGLRGIMRPIMQNDAVRLVIEDPPETLTLFTDEGKLAQILRNLIANALKFTDTGEVRLSLSSADSILTFAVSDTGIGISPEHQQVIFQEFAQIDNPLQRRVKGTGLGLPLSRKLAELLGGSLTVHSEPGVGSTFFLTLPAAFVPPEGGNRPVVLIVDDDERSRYLVRQMFQAAEYDISEAQTASEGLERARFEKPALVFLDLDLPDGDGFHVLRELRADPAVSQAAVVIYTAAILGPADIYRLADKHDAILPKSAMGSGEAYAIVQRVLMARDLPALAGLSTS